MLSMHWLSEMVYISEITSSADLLAGFLLSAVLEKNIVHKCTNTQTSFAQLIPNKGGGRFSCPTGLFSLRHTSNNDQMVFLISLMTYTSAPATKS